MGWGGIFSLVRKRIGMDNFPEPISFLNSVFSPSSEDCRISTHQRPSIDNRLPLLSYQLLPLWFYCRVINELLNLWEVLVVFSTPNLCYTTLLLGSCFCSFILIGFKWTSNILIGKWLGTGPEKRPKFSSRSIKVIFISNLKLLKPHPNVEVSNRYRAPVIIKPLFSLQKSVILRLKKAPNHFFIKDVFWYHKYHFICIKSRINN